MATLNNFTEIKPQPTSYKPPAFCALYNIGNEHIIKDHGLLSYGMMIYHGCNSFMATYKNSDYPNLKYIPGVHMEFIPDKTGNFVKDSLVWLRKNAKRISILFIYHNVMRSFLHACIYKLFNPRGKIYLKLDGWPMKKRGSLWKRPLYGWLMRHADCVSTELEENAEILSKEWNRKIVWVPNPANPDELQDFRPFSERSKTILTVGRLGTKQKATEILLEAFAKIADQIPDWTLKLAGYIAENMNIASDFYSAHPELKQRVIFTGEIRDRNELVEMYRDSKVFAFPSRWESFGIALTEAMMQGCFAITTDIPPSRSLTENFRYGLGSAVDDVDGLAKNLLYACTHESETEALALKGMNATRERIDMKRCCDVIAGELK